MICTSASATCGSSPLTRGKLFPALVVGFRWGLIPAHAGKTAESVAPHGTKQAHPRSRGENEALAASDATDKGSSPLTRGKPEQQATVGVLQGLIPAHAGKTIAWRGRSCRQRAHPRSRGENSTMVSSVAVSRGSSPLTRGKRLPVCVPRDWVGLIPAHAGKTCPRTRPCARCGAHPRSRGENAGVGASSTISAGSSPLTRGKHGGGRGLSRAVGLIPAHAGKTAVEPLPLGRGWAHPRSRGENSVIVVSFRCGQGSSPLTRGKLYDYDAHTDTYGLIPAHAGKTRG